MSSARKFTVAAAGGALAMILVHYWRDLYWHHAFIIGLAAAGLVYWSLRAVENLRQL